jgi:cellulose synthase/poly-beta-1,6-N-acetylglucosamine synthase-like glycosyltransferase
MGVGGSNLMTEPCVSVIVPVRDRRAMLATLLKGLASQTYRDFELVVVDDGSTDGSGEEAEAAAGIGLNIHVVRTSGVGAVEARRRGVAASRGEILAFTDSDCIPDPTWLEHGVAALRDGIDLVQGRTEPIRPVGLLERSVWIEHEDGLYATCNVLYRREAFDRAGGFDDAHALLGFRPGAFGRGLGFGEDALLGWKLRREGRALFAPEAVVRHEVVRPSLSELIRRSWMAGAFPSLIREIPELGSTLLTRRVFLGTRRIPLYAVVVGLLLRRPGLAALAAAWWVGARAVDAQRREKSPGKVAGGVAVELGADVVTGAALIGGSVRARRAVL